VQGGLIQVSDQAMVALAGLVLTGMGSLALWIRAVQDTASARELARVAGRVVREGPKAVMLHRLARIEAFVDALDDRNNARDRSRMATAREALLGGNPVHWSIEAKPHAERWVHDEFSTVHLSSEGMGLVARDLRRNIADGHLTDDEQVHAENGLRVIEGALASRERLRQSAQEMTQDRKLARLLLIEDDHAAAELTQIVLRVTGYEVAAVGSAEAAMSEIHRAHGAGQPYQILVIDLVLPDVYGLELIRRLRASVLTESTPIVAISGARGGEYAITAGADMFVAKPYTPTEIREAVAAVLQEGSRDVH